MEQNNFVLTENYQRSVSKLRVESKILLSNKPHDSLKIHKSKSQLLHLLKTRNQEKGINSEEQGYINNKLNAVGFNTNEIIQLVSIEKYRFNKSRELRINDKVSNFETRLNGFKDVENYLEKNQSLVLYNQIILQNFPKDGRSFDKKFKLSLQKRSKSYNKKTLRDMQLYKDNFSLIKNRYAVIEEIQGEEIGQIDLNSRNEFTKKKEEYLSVIEKYLFMKRVHHDNRASYPIESFIDDIDQIVNNSELKDVLANLKSQLKLFDDIFCQDNQDLVNQINNAVYYNQGNQEYTQQIMNKIEKDLVIKTVEILENKFFESLSRTSHTTLRLAQSCKNLSNEVEQQKYQSVLAFVEQNYLRQEFLEENQSSISFDEHKIPIWSIIFVLFRAGKISEISFLLENYQGNIDLNDFKKLFSKYIDSERNHKKIDEGFIRQAISQIRSGRYHMDIFQNSLYLIITKQKGAFLQDILNELFGFIWFNLKMVNINEENILDNINYATVKQSHSLAELQREIGEMGPEYFGSSPQSPWKYVKILFFTLSFSEAIEFLKESDIYFEEFVHLSIILRECGLVMNPHLNQPGALRCKDILSRYIRKFVKSNPIEAFTYLLFLSKQEAVNMISKLIIENSLFIFFFDNDSASNNNRLRLKEVLGENMFQAIVDRIIEQTRTKSPEIAMKILDTFQEYDAALRMIVIELGFVYSKYCKKLNYSSEKNKEKVLLMTNSLLNKYRNSFLKENHHELKLVIKMLETLNLAYQLSESNLDDECLTKLYESGLIPSKELEFDNYLDCFNSFTAHRIENNYLEIILLTIQKLNILKKSGKHQLRNKRKGEHIDLGKLSRVLYVFYHNSLKPIISGKTDISFKEITDKINEESMQLQLNM